MTDSGLVRLLHPTGNANVKQVIRALVEADKLEMFVTGIGFSSGSAANHLGHLFQSRMYDVPESRYLSSRPLPEIWRLLLLHGKSDRARTAAMYGRFGIDWVSSHVDRRSAATLSASAASAVYGYSSHSSQSFELASRLGIGRVLEVHHAHWETAYEISEAAQEQYPQWHNPIASRGRDVVANVRADQELEYAQVAVCPSTQVLESVKRTAFQGKTVHVPYGCPPPVQRTSSISPQTAKLKVLYVGRLDLMKGFPVLMSAWNEALRGKVDLTVIGRLPAVSPPGLRDFLSQVQYLGPQSHAMVQRRMLEHDVLVAPSYVEGRSLVVSEAMSAGLPVVITRGTGCEDLALGGAGLIMDVGSGESMVDRLSVLDSERSKLDAMSSAASKLAVQNSWAAFRRGVLGAVSSTSSVE
ncbi:glycosyltransferase involved in cell wall biosynthesis [Nocardioides salarius]|uniref:Glycosyltransferase involved in cell wall biosynthesis n=1 Tax=Nocardioides salarius TaxID=374513 RepID=A0ABS2M902_9ACTN|nr:glycosyltransferase [Nocardioides salarius]MBM7507663.1 glycosyltransferase involved in cell wall biosynthesis [Nocardioides salarius]